MEKKYPPRTQQIVDTLRITPMARSVYSLPWRDNDLPAYDLSQVVVMCHYGDDKARLLSTNKALVSMLTYRPMPMIYFVEGSFTKNFHYQSMILETFKQNSVYFKIPLTNKCKGMFIKEALWNYAIINRRHEFENYTFLDSDCDFMDRHWVNETKIKLQKYRVVSPMSHVIYSTLDKYGFVPTCGYLSETNPNSTYPGFPGMAVSMQASFYHDILKCMPNVVVGFGDIVLWGMLLGSDRFRNYKCRVYPVTELSKYNLPKIKISYVDGVLRHHDHGPINDRHYVAKAKALNEFSKMPFSEYDCDESTNWLPQWKDTDEVRALRCRLNEIV